MRLPWREQFPHVFTHSAWQSTNGKPALPDHSGYFPAKERKDAGAALKICDDLGVEGVLEEIYDTCFMPGNQPPPIVIAPALAPHESNNALAITYAQWLAHEMGWDVNIDVYRSKTVSRDFVTSGWFRLINEPEYYGEIHEGRRYVIADDVCTMGGTLNSLRSFIESKGATVTCMTTLATGNGQHMQISLEEDTFNRLTKAMNGELADIIYKELGYEVACLTEPEGNFLLRCPSIDALRAGIDGARNA